MRLGVDVDCIHINIYIDLVHWLVRMGWFRQQLTLRALLASGLVSQMIGSRAKSNETLLDDLYT